MSLVFQPKRRRTNRFKSRLLFKQSCRACVGTLTVALRRLIISRVIIGNPSDGVCVCGWMTVYQIVGSPVYTDEAPRLSLLSISSQLCSSVAGGRRLVQGFTSFSFVRAAPASATSRLTGPLPVRIPFRRRSSSCPLQTTTTTDDRRDVM